MSSPLLPRFLLLVLLLGPALLNLLAGARRPQVERALLKANHYPEADAAAQALKGVPLDTPVAVLTYDGDKLDELDCATWFDYRLKWLTYPRKFSLFRIDAQGDIKAAPGYPAPRFRFEAHPVVLAFRVTKPLPGPPVGYAETRRGRMWTLLRRSAR